MLIVVGVIVLFLVVVSFLECLCKERGSLTPQSFLWWCFGIVVVAGIMVGVLGMIQTTVPREHNKWVGNKLDGKW
jgi:NADH:ubiquinone oxidoreductase subunit 6 (subunit J)